jgi:2-keto-4-pentenoate hydratase/2-oxohepta-3-ene-1,7-dioic acid hydratase in catechol pathway
VKLAALYRGDTGVPALHVAVEDGFAAVDELAAAGGAPDLGGLHDVGELYARGPAAVGRLRELASGAQPGVGQAGARYAPPVLRPGKILCVGLNYADHIAESRAKPPERIVLFAKFSSCLIAHGEPIIRPAITSELDYEGELAVIIGKPGRYIARAAAWDHIAGYACYNEGSVRDYQRHTHQFTPGKNFPGTGAFGPWMVTPDEAGDLGPLRLQTRLNGEVVQDATISQMIFDIPRQIEYCSSFTRLEPGDVIVTGTPGGVGSRRTPPLWMKPGDVVEVEIDRIGLLRNGVADET